MAKNIILLGSTGSIGTNACRIVERYPDRFRIIALACGVNSDLLALQIRKFNPLVVSVRDEIAREKLKENLSKEGFNKVPTILTGEEGLMQVASVKGADLLVNGLVGFIGVKPTMLALENGLNVALANKETLVIGGEIVTQVAKENNADILPIDSEHSAIFQCLQVVRQPYRDNVRKIILTASGGPFWEKDISEMENASVEDVMKHPNWSMGQKVTVDSATLMNKGLEIIEAKTLFGLYDEQIDVVVHRQSIIHSMVELMDGSVLAQLGYPDMEIPIQLSMSYPDRIPSTVKSLDLTEIERLTFQKPDYDRFPCLGIAIKASKTGGLATACLNGADEGAVNLFLDGKISFGRIPKLIKDVMEVIPINDDINIENALMINELARNKALEMADVG